MVGERGREKERGESEKNQTLRDLMCQAVGMCVCDPFVCVSLHVFCV